MDALEGVNSTTVFNRRRRAAAVLKDDPKNSLPLKCCERCKSDLNRKLIIKCKMCAFRCHLYCFVPPLKQHPVFLLRLQHQTTQSGQDSSPTWTCEKCAGTAIVFNFNLNTRKISSSTSPSIKKTASSYNTRKSDSTSTPFLKEALQAGDQSGASSGWIQSVQPQWIENSAVVFDWYRFRSRKAETLSSLDNKANHFRNGVNELVFYSKSYTLLRKTACAWREYAIIQKRFRHQNKVETKAIMYPSVKGNVIYTQKIIDINTTINANENELNATEDEDIDLCDLNQYITHYKRPPQLPLLWEGEAPSALMGWTTDERQEVAGALDEIKEGVDMMDEDVNASCPPQEMITNINTDIKQTTASYELQHHSKSLTTYAAAIIIQRTFASYCLRRRHGVRSSRQRRVLEDTKRTAKAQSSVALLRTCVYFIILLLRIHRLSRAKKSTVLILHNAAEDSQIMSRMVYVAEDHSQIDNKLERVRQLAQVRIRHFFTRRAHPYVKLKKTTMIRRLQRWWRCMSNLRKWRKVRLARRVRASTKIQMFYRHLQTQRQTTELIKNHALVKLQRSMTRWIFSRFARKKVKMCVTYEAVSQLTLAGNQLPESVPLDEVLEKQGVELYQRGDFWNAASILERLCDLRNGKLTKNLFQALAYSHHMTWYVSYDQFNLSRSHELYCAALERAPAGDRIDPLVLQDLAIVMMHKEHFSASLRLFAKLIESFPRLPQFPLWLLLAAVQLQQRGDWTQSVEYLIYLHDIPPPPYLERDMLVLCAIGYEQLAITAAKTPKAKSSSALFAKEAWHTALRQWNLEKLTTKETGSNVTVRRRESVVSKQKQKWELLIDLGQRAFEQGHYLIACRVYIYALEHEGTISDIDLDKRGVAWWNLADAFRHLGHLAFYADLVKHSQGSLPGQNVSDELHKNWLKIANHQATCFQTELSTLTVADKLRQLNSA
ncbi:unnamed protein product [Phytophthora fragariaefolia]|uniref:Unnamed protein product n=1 Tax=Phytophthora fragariaefolia TaxID=1490495 RepID=A0A9W6YQN1_9STRA|nr:unnamed protein product [Phytophthora fragariaefolia]